MRKLIEVKIVDLKSDVEPEPKPRKAGAESASRIPVERYTRRKSDRLAGKIKETGRQVVSFKPEGEHRFGGLWRTYDRRRNARLGILLDSDC